MLLLREWKKEKETLHYLSQILGKYKLCSSFKEPQWAHVVLDVTTNGFTTGMIYYNDITYSLSVNLRNSVIEVVTDLGSESIKLEDGKSIKDYYESIDLTLKKLGVDIEISKTPQEVEDTTEFDKDTKHCHYNEKFSDKILEMMHFAIKVQSKFLSKYRMRKVKPALFWGTFDISCLLIYNELYYSFDETKPIEYNAFDEHFVEFGFWFGDDNYEGSTFFILSHPFVDKDFEYEADFPEEVKFDKNLTEFVFENKDMSNETAKKLVDFMEKGYGVFKKHLGWERADFCEIPLNIKDNQLEQNFC